MRYCAAIIVVVLLATPVSAVQEGPNPSTTAFPLQDILKRMSAYEERHKARLISYQVERKFHATNPKFKKEAFLEVKTVFSRPGNMDSEVLRSEGSKMIRERVFDKILEAEKEANATKQEVSITPANYNFVFVGKQDCDGRSCVNLKITPKKKSKYSINGHIWVDAEDGAIVRILGSPAKRPSFWTTSTEIRRKYKLIDGVWLCSAMESNSNIFIAGPSTLKIDYNYVKVETENVE
jgi:hypothetical protein